MTTCELKQKTGMVLTQSEHDRINHSINHDEMDRKWLIVPKGQLTFDAEGNDIYSSLHFSRMIRWTGNDASGITIGRGYELGSRAKSDVFIDMLLSGVSLDTAEQISAGSGLKGIGADNFVNTNKNIIGEISRQSQYQLFNLIYQKYEARAKANYIKWTTRKKHIDWSLLDAKIRDVAVDLVCQGLTKSARPMIKCMNNNKTELIEYIESNSILNMDEKRRRRAKYLKN